MSGMWPAWVDTRSVFPMSAAGPLICPDPTGRGPSHIQPDKARNKTGRAAAQLEMDEGVPRETLNPVKEYNNWPPYVTHVAAVTATDHTCTTHLITLHRLEFPL